MKIRIKNKMMTKTLFMMLFLYEVIFSRIGLYIPYMSTILLMATIVVGYLELSQNIPKAIRFKGLFGFCLLFLLLNTLISAFIAVNVSQANSALSRFAEYLALMLICLMIGIEDKNLHYFTLLMFILAIIMTLLVYVRPVRYFASSDYTVYLTIADNMSPHSVGVYILFGLWALFYEIPRFKVGFFTTVVVLALIVVMCGAIFLTNSRKSLVGVALLLVFAFPNLMRYVKRSLSSGKLVLFTILIICAIIAGLSFLERSQLLSMNNMVYRLNAGVNDESNGVRVDVMNDAFKVFLKYPLLGVGMDNYRYYSSLNIYSHNTYVELLACCGVLGGLPFALFLFKIIKILISRYFRSLALVGKTESFHYHMIISMIIVLLYFGMMQIMFYERTLMFAFSIIIAYLLIVYQTRQANHMESKNK